MDEVNEQTSLGLTTAGQVSISNITYSAISRPGRLLNLTEMPNCAPHYSGGVWFVSVLNLARMREPRLRLARPDACM